jgi:orotate phosphoribosyltransferase
MAIALDRQEKAIENGRDVSHSAVQYVSNVLGLRVCTIATLADLLHYLQAHGTSMAQHTAAVQAYRARYGVG